MAIRITATVKIPLLGILLLGAAGDCFGQAQSEESKKPGIAVRSEVVLVPAVVTNRAGAHVSDLNQGDFTVLQDGHPQKIAFFHHIQTSAEPIERAAAPGKESTNPMGGISEQSMIFVLDLLNSTVAEQTTGREELMKFLSASPNFAEPVSLVAFDSYGVRLIHGFTTNSAQLIEALKEVKGQRSPKDAPTINPLESHFRMVQGWHSRSATRNAAAAEGRLDFLEFSTANREANVSERTWLTLEALREIAEALTGVPGRKSLIWTTGGGFPFQIDDASHFGLYERELLPAYENVWRTFDRLNIAVYPLDVEDLVNPAYVGPGVGQPLPQHFDAHSNVSNLESFAEATGGRLCDRQTTALGCFREAADDSSDYYLIGFYENSANSKPGWRKLAVKVDRPEMHVRARSGYFLRGPEDENLVRKEEIAFALTSPLESTGVRFMVQLTLVTDVSGKKRIEFNFVLPPAVATIDESDSNHINLDFAALVKAPDGTAVAVFSQKFEARLKPEAVNALKSTGGAYPGTIDVPAGEYTVRFVIRDNLTGLVGSTSASLKVP